MGRLSERLARASAAIDNLDIAAERHVSKLIERTDEVHKRMEQVFQRKHEQLDGHIADVAAFNEDLDTFDGKNEHSGAGGSSSENNGSAYAGTNLKT